MRGRERRRKRYRAKIERADERAKETCVRVFFFRKIVLFFKILHVTRDFAKGPRVLDNRRTTRVPTDVKSKNCKYR